MAENSLFSYTEDVCVICQAVETNDAQELIVLTERGLVTLQNYAGLHGALDLQNYLLGNPSAVRVHESCRRKFTSKRRYEQTSKDSSSSSSCPLPDKPQKLLRSAVSFDWKSDCFFCCEPAIHDSRHPQRCSVHAASTMGIRESVLSVCVVRDDKWAHEVRGRLEGCCDLVATEAVYHRLCHTMFFQMKPSEHADKNYDAKTDFKHIIIIIIIIIIMNRMQTQNLKKCSKLANSTSRII